MYAVNELMIGSFYLSDDRILKTLRVILSLKEDKQSKNFFHCTKQRWPDQSYPQTLLQGIR